MWLVSYSSFTLLTVRSYVDADGFQNVPSGLFSEGFLVGLISNRIESRIVNEPCGKLYDGSLEAARTRMKGSEWMGRWGKTRTPRRNSLRVWAIRGRYCRSTS